MKVLGKISDKMLSAFAPRAEAGACIPEHGDTVFVSCGCKDSHYYRKTCTVGCTGTLSCGTCARTQNIC